MEHDPKTGRFVRKAANPLPKAMQDSYGETLWTLEIALSKWEAVIMDGPGT